MWSVVDDDDVVVVVVERVVAHDAAPVVVAAVVAVAAVVSVEHHFPVIIALPWLKVSLPKECLLAAEVRMLMLVASWQMMTTVADN